MVKEETSFGGSQDSEIFRRDSIILNREVYEFKREDMPFLIELLKDIYPTINLANYKILKEISNTEFNYNLTENDFERYFSPSLEGIEAEYRYKLNMV